jgi:hypothetical protein
MADLIDLDRARQNIPSAANTDEPTISTLISSVSRAIVRYCRRDFVQTDYDEVYSGSGERRLILRQYPLLKIASVRYRPVTVLKIQNTLAGTPIARVRVTSAGLTLTRVTSGSIVTDSSVTFAGNATMAALQAAVNALGNGWQAVGQGYDAWPALDLYCPNGLAATSPDAPLPASQGDLTAAGQFAELKLHTYELAGFQLDARRGWLLRAIPYSDPELLHPEDLIWPIGINNFRVQYSAGYATVPEDVQEACAEWVATLFKDLGRNQNVASEATSGVYSVRSFDRAALQPPYGVRTLLAPYRNFRVFNGQS